MRIPAALNILSTIIFLTGLFLLTPAIVSLIYGEVIFWQLLGCAGFTILTGGGLYFATHRHRGSDSIGNREGFAIVTFGWLSMAFFGALPFYVTSDSTGQFVHFVDAFFESMSGFTTTGASILQADFETKVIENLPKGILFWRSLTHWIGGMGIILFSLMVLSVLGMGGMAMFRAEVPGPIPDKISSTVSSTAKTLWYVYIILSVIEFLFLWLFGYGMPAFDAICHTFGTMATGGFSTKDSSIGHYALVGDPLASYYEMVFVIFMTLAGVNFALHFNVLAGRPLALFRNPEFRFYLGLIFGVSTLIFGYNMLHTDDGWWEGDLFRLFRGISFTVSSIITTTGYGTEDFGTWAPFAQYILLLLMFIGGSAGSTSGGMKVIRVMILIKHSYYQMVQMFHPRAIFSIRIGDLVIGRTVLNQVISFFLLFMLLFGMGVLLLTFMGIDLITALTAVVACIGNIGPGLGKVGPAENFGWMPDAAKWVLSFLMLVGRLEIYTVLVLFFPRIWRK